MISAGRSVDPAEVIELRSLEDAERVRGPWLELVQRVGGSYFMTPDWVLSWWELLGERRPARIAVWRAPHGPDLEAVVPLGLHVERLHHRVPVRVSAWVNLGSGFGSADHLAFPAVAERRRDVGHWLGSVARRSPLLLRSLPPGESTRLGLSRGTLIEKLKCPAMGLDGGAVPAAFRKKLRYYRRRLGAEGVEFQVVGPGGVGPELLSELFDLHEARWALKPEASSSGLRARRDFFLALTAAGGGERGPTAVVARRDNRVVGVLLGLWFGSTYSYFQTGWDPDLKNLSIGTALVDVAIEDAIDRGADVFDFLRGTTDYKYRFGGIDAVDETWLYGGGFTGRLLRYKYTAGREVARGGLRSALRRRQR